jgi:hypothetical protein
MLASTYGGDPVLGNASFGFNLSQAPSNGIAVLMLRYGALGPGLPVPLRSPLRHERSHARSSPQSR